MMDLLLGYRERDHSPEVREAAKLAIQLVAEFTLDIVEEGYEEVLPGSEGSPPIPTLLNDYFCPFLCVFFVCFVFFVFLFLLNYYYYY